jgi:hypothetical protein
LDRILHRPLFVSYQCFCAVVAGTCRMGASPTDGSVVSSADFSLWGVNGLRVIDASVVPNIPGGQTGAVTFMLAERAAGALQLPGFTPCSMCWVFFSCLLQLLLHAGLF